MLTVTAEAVLIAVAELPEGEKTCKFDQLAHRATCSYASVYRAVGKLTREGLISATRPYQWGNSIYHFALTKRGQEMVTGLKLLRLGGLEGWGD